MEADMRYDGLPPFPDYRTLTPEEWQALKRRGLELARDEHARAVNELFGRLFRWLFGGLLAGLRRLAKRVSTRPKGFSSDPCPGETGGR